jgi:hypothetical protein
MSAGFGREEEKSAFPSVMLESFPTGKTKHLRVGRET